MASMDDFIKTKKASMKTGAEGTNYLNSDSVCE